MKKQLSMLLLILSLLLVLAGCNETDPPVETEPAEESSSIEETSAEETTEEDITEESETYEPLSKEMDWKIRETYRDTYVTLQNYYETEALSLRYFGEFNGAYVVFVDGDQSYSSFNTGITVAGVHISYPTMQRMMVYHEKSGTFQGLRGAYGDGWLTFEDLLMIKERYEGFGEMTKEEYRTLVYVEPLSDTLEQKIKDSYIRDGGDPEYGILIEYEGGFHGSHVMFVHNPGLYYQMVTFDRVEDLVFLYPDSRSMCVYNEESDSFLDLKAAYEAGWLTYEDLVLLQRRYGEAYSGWEGYLERVERYAGSNGNLPEIDELPK